MTRRAFTAADAVVVALLLAANWAPAARREPGPPLAAEVVAEGKARREALGESRRLRVAGPLGETEILLEADGARVVSSPCPLQVCVRTGKIALPGEAVACLPNRVAVRLLGGDGQGGVDAVGR